MNIIQIKKIYKKYSVPKNIIKHMEKVRKVCAVLTNELIKKGIKIDKKTVLNAALIHDVLRIKDNHEENMCKILKKMGEEKIANLVKKHAFPYIDNLKTWEEKTLYYADKRVSENKIVTLEERFGKRNNRDLKTETKVKKLEKKFVKILGKLPI